MATPAAFPAVHATVPAIKTENSRKAQAEDLNIRDTPAACLFARNLLEF
jgi:hypothetical protein